MCFCNLFKEFSFSYVIYYNYSLMSAPKIHNFWQYCVSLHKRPFNKLSTSKFKIKKKERSMIDFSQFELKESCEMAIQGCSIEKIQAIQSAEQCPTAFSLSSIDEPNILEMQNHLDSCDLSENLLDRLESIEKDLQPPDKGSHFQDIQLQQNHRKKSEQRMKNETKNIPKNFGKGIIGYIEKNQLKLRKVLKQHCKKYGDFLSFLKQEKQKINTIAGLRKLWTDELYGRPMRIISNLFFRKYSLQYIFNSRISNYGSHVKYRQALWNALRNPEQFNHMKDF